MLALPGAPITLTPTRHQLPARRPARAAALAWAVYSVSLAVWLVLPWDRGTESAGGWAMTLGIDLTRIVVAVAFLGVWRLWRPAGFLTPPTWKRVIPALPLLLLPALPAVFGPGLPDRPGWKFALLAFGVATVAFGEEGMFRGVVMRVLLVRGVRPALFGSAALFGLMHLVNLVNDSHPVTVAAQVIMAFGIGIGFGAVALATGTIWPLLVVHFLMNFINSIQAAAPGEDTGMSVSDLLLNGGINVVLGMLAAGYGLWLLHRRAGLIGQLDAPAAPTE
jgi:membrane protease YdiL (CAAX protease family)